MTGTHRTSKVIVGVEPWDTEWAAERAAEALRYLGTHYPDHGGTDFRSFARARPRPALHCEALERKAPPHQTAPR
jgi:hypothetical protein